MKIIIVEDERVTRDGLDRLLKKIDGVEILAKCANAQVGFKEIRDRRPDVVISDIVMGGESGLDMIEWCRTAGIQCEFVLLSGYSEFEYARRALKLNVFDYLNKPLDFGAMEGIVERLNEKLSNNRKIVDRSVDYFSGTMQRDSLEKPEFLERGDLYVVAANFYHLETEENDREFGRQCCGQITEKYVKSYCRYIEKNGMHCELVSCDEDMNAFTSALLSFVKSHSCKLGLGIRMGISQSFEDISDINTGIAQAVAAAQACAVQKKNIERADLLSYPIAADPEVMFTREFARIRDQLLGLDAAEVCRTVLRVLDGMMETVPPYGLYAFLRRCVRVICWNFNEDKDAYVSSEIGDRISSAPSLESLQARFRDIVQAQMKPMRKEDDLGGDDAVGKAINYIRIHYAQPIRSAEVAQMFYIDPTYFSKQFNKKVGKNYSRYVTELRMGKAERLLQLGGYSIAEVAQMVGYQSPRHFSRLFRQHSGKYPSDIHRD